MEKDRAYYDSLHEAVSRVANRDHAGGLEACERALGMSPDGHEAECILALIAADMGDFGRSLELLNEVHKKAPDCREYADVMAVILARAGKVTDSLYYAKLALALDSDPEMDDLIPPSFRNYKAALDNAAPSPNYVNATIRFQQYNYREAEELCLRHLRLNEYEAPAYLLLGRCRMAQGKYEAALADLHTAVHLNPADPESHLNLGHCLVRLGRFDEARACHDAAAALAPADPQVRFGALASFLPMPEPAWRGVFAAGQAVAEACFADADPVDRDGMAGETPERLRIGYISDGLHDTEIGRLLSGVFNAHDRKRFETFAYQQNVHTDPVTTRLKANANHWKEIHDVDDDTLAYIMASDGLDILVDLCSYTGEQRAGLLARKPAAVVASWLSWPFGAGLPALDCVISDAASLEADRAVAGEVPCLPSSSGLLAYDAAALTIDFDSFGGSPAAENGFVTFGAVCDASRITPDTARVFARVLRAVPGAYLMFGYGDTLCPAVVQRLRELFSHFGMLGRIAFQTPVDDRPANQQFHANVDIVLDSFPVNGVFETCESLRAGVPVVTLAGDRRAGRMGASILRAAGKPEWIAESEEAFVKTAASLAAAPGELAGLRKTLGRAVADSPLCDLRAFTAGLEEVYEQIVRDKKLR